MQQQGIGLLVKLGIAILAVLLFTGGFIISAGLILGALTQLAWLILAVRVPLLRKLARQFPAVADIGAGILTYWLLPSGVIGVVAAATVAITTSAVLHWDITRGPTLDRWGRPVKEYLPSCPTRTSPQ